LKSEASGAALGNLGFSRGNLNGAKDVNRQGEQRQLKMRDVHSLAQSPEWKREERNTNQLHNFRSWDFISVPFGYQSN